MPSQESKPSNSQSNFVFAKIRRLNKTIFTTFQEKDNGFDLQLAQRTLKGQFFEAEQITMYLVDHLAEDITEDFLINSFTDLQDEMDDTVKKFKQMLEETNQRTDPVEPSQIQQPSSHIQPTSHDHLPSTSALPHLLDSLGDQLTHQTLPSSQQPSITDPPQVLTLPLSRPKIKIEPFTGDPMKWNTWHGLFTTMIVKQPLSVAEKTTHLQTLTTGKADEAIAGFSCNPDLYLLAMEELQRRFGRPDIIVSNFLAQLQTQRPPSTHHKDSFMEFSVFLNNLVETFQSLGFYHDLQSTVYVQFALNKLQHKEKLQWSQYVIQNHITQPNIIIFNTWFRDFDLACDHKPADIPTNSRTTQQQEHHPKVINRPPNTSTLNYNRPQQTCPFDKQSHHPSH